MGDYTHGDVDFESALLLETLRELLGLFHTDVLDFPTSTLDLLVAEFHGCLASLFLLVATSHLCAATRLLLLLANRQLGQ